jgi:uncharacterized protein DUF4349
METRNSWRIRLAARTQFPQQCDAEASYIKPPVTPPHSTGRRTRAGIAAACIAGGMLLAGCGAGTSSVSSGQAQPAGAAGAQGLAPQSKARVPANAGASGSAAIPLAAGSNIVYTATLTVRARDIAAEDANAKRIVTDAGGYVSNENSSLNPAHPELSTVSLELKIPVDSYPATLNNLATQLGTQVSLQQQAQDVTENVADVNSRVTSAQAAISQLRALLSRAGSVSDLLNIQNQISQQESDLESLQAEQRALNHETAYATLSLRLISVPPPPAKPKQHKHVAGFIRGLNAGWHALRWFGAGLFALVGVLIPFTVLIAAAGYLAYRSRRWLLARRTPPATTE